MEDPWGRGEMLKGLRGRGVGGWRTWSNLFQYPHLIIAEKGITNKCYAGFSKHQDLQKTAGIMKCFCVNIYAFDELV